MELEVGLKMTRTRAHDNTTSVSELRISKATAGPVFVSTETHAMFILTCYLKGYNRNSFDIKISEDGREICISGEKPVQEMLMIGRVMLKKEVEIVGFRKVFKIPNGVVLDRIKAKFDEDESLLKIVMPKLVKGICGVQIEEVKMEEGYRESSQKASEIGKNEESIFQKEEGLSDKKLVESTTGDVTADKIQKEIESPRFKAMKKLELGENVDHIPKIIGDTSQEVLKEPMIQPLDESENIGLGRPPGIAGEDKFEGTQKKEIREFNFENEGKDEEGVGIDITKEGPEAIETIVEGGKPEKVLAGKVVVCGKGKVEGIEEGEIEEPKFETQDRDELRVEDIPEGKQKKEIEEKKFESEDRDGERLGTEISKEGLEAIDTTMEERESEKVLAGAFGVTEEGIVDETKQGEIEEAKFETEGKDEKRVGKEKVEGIEEGEIEEPTFETQDRDEQRVEDIPEGKQKKETEEKKFEIEGRDEERLETEISKGGLETIDTTMEGRESEKVLAGAFGVTEEGIVDETKQGEIEEAKFETEGKDEKRVGKEKVEGIEEGEIEEPTFETQDRDEQRVEDIPEGKQKKETEEKKFEIEGRDEERLETEISKGGLETIDTTMEGRESEKVLAGAFGVTEEGIVDETKQGEIEEAKFETEGKDEKRVGKEKVEGIEEGEIEEPTFETQDRDEQRVEDIPEGKQKKEIEEKKFESEGRDGERLGTEISMGGLETIDTTMKERESEKVIVGALRVNEEGIVDETKQGEIEEVKFETEGKDEKRVGKEKVEGIEEGETEEPTFEIQDRDEQRVEDILEGKQKKEIEEKKFEIEGKDEERVGTEITKEGFEAIEEAKFQRVKEEKSMAQKNANSKVANLEGIEEAKEAMAKRWSQEAEGFLEKVEGEKPKMTLEASKVVVKGNARESDKKGIEEFDIRSSRDGQHVQVNIVKEVFEMLETDITEFPKQMLKTKAHKERAVKVKKEVVINTHDEAKRGFEKPKTGDRIQLATGQPSIGFKDSDERGFDGKEILEAAKWDKIEPLKEGSVETEPYVEKVKGVNNDKVQGEAFRDFMKDKKGEKTQKEREEPKVGTKHRDQQYLQEIPTKIAESLDVRERPKDTKTEDMKEAKRISGENRVVADDESIAKERIQEAEIGRMWKTTQLKKALQEVPEAKDPKASGKGMLERESRLSTQQSEGKVKDKICEEYKRLEANLEREKCKTAQSFKDEKPRRENEIIESKLKTHEKDHPRKSKELEKEVKPLDAKGAYPGAKKEVETKNEVEEVGMKELPPPKVKLQSLEPLELEKQNMKWKFLKTKKHVSEAREEEEEEYDVVKPPEVKSSLSTEQSMVDKQKPEIDFPESSMSRTPMEEKEIEALQPNVLVDQNLEEKEYFKTLTEDRGHYILENEKRLETKTVAEEEKLNQKYGEETFSCQRERTKIEECEEDEKLKIKKNTFEFEDGSEKINHKQVAEEFKEVVADNETEKSQKEIPSPQTTEMQSKEEISKKREVQQEKRRQIPFHADEESKVVTYNKAVESPKPTAAHLESSMDFSSDKPKGEVDELQIKELSPPIEKLSKEPSEITWPSVKEYSPKVENFSRFQEGKEPTYSFEGTKTSEAIAKLDKPSPEKLEFAEEGKIDECHDGGHLKFQELEKQESEIDFQEPTKRRSDQEVEKTQFSQQEANHERHAIEEEKDGEQENEVQVEISQELEDLEDIKVEACEKKMELRAPMFIAGSVLIASLIIFFIDHKKAGRR